MSLNLGIKPASTELPVVDLSDVLSAELEFTETYQAFLDYRNTCEIVVKAKASTERQAFAQELLGVSIENISVSVEKFTTALRRAWEKFVGWVKQVISYVKYAIIKHTFKKDGEFSVEVDSREYCKSQLALLESAIQKLDKGEDAWDDLDKMTTGEGDAEVITTRAALVEWLRIFDKTIYALNRFVKRKSDDPRVASVIQYTLSEKSEWKNSLKRVFAIVKKSKDNAKQPTETKEADD